MTDEYTQKQIESLQDLETKIAKEKITGVIENRKLHKAFEQLIEDHWNLKKPRLYKGIRFRQNKKSVVAIVDGKKIAKVRKIQNTGDVNAVIVE